MTMQKKFGIAVVTALLAWPVAAQAQGIPGGAERGAAEGSAVGGPVGGAVGGVVGGVAGGIGGLLGADQAPRFHDYVIREHRSAYRYSEDPQVGMILPPSVVVFYRVPREYGVSPAYRYTIINDHAVLVDPRTRKVVQVID
jgi:Protein of unknown function (DUF1236)